ncbi:MAG: ABC transporter permease [Acidobacteriota bacterium]
MRSTWAVAIKELRQIRRDRRTLTILIVIPTFFLFLYGYALNFDIRHVSMAVEDRDDSRESHDLIAAFQRSTYFDIMGATTSDREASALVDRGLARIVLVIPAGFAADLGRGQTAEVQVIIDGDNANTATTVLGYVTAVLRMAASPPPDLVRVAMVSVQPRVWYNPELRSTVFLVPGLIAFISMITAVISTALSIVREKERGTMEQIRMAPISTMAFVVGKTLPYLVLSFIGAMTIIGAAMVFFDLPMRGSWPSLMLVVVLFLIGALGTGLLVSTMAETQQVAFQAAALIAMLPTLILSGFIFPLASMPVALQYISSIVPARYFLVALRGIVLKGLDLSTVWTSLLALLVYAAVVLGLSAVRLSRQ